MDVNPRAAVEWCLRLPLRVVAAAVEREIPRVDATVIEDLGARFVALDERLDALVRSQEATNSALASLTTVVCTLDLGRPAPASHEVEDQLDQLLALQQRTNDLLELVLAAFASQPRATSA
jgi:hypothetical protein